MYSDVRQQVAARIEEIQRDGLYKRERVLETPQQPRVSVAGREVLNLCANNYLGLANHPEVIEAAREAVARWGFGMASVRFICGTQSIHRELESRLSRFLGTEDAILYSSCFDANGGLFETLLDERDAVVSDELNHASIIDGIRLSKAQRFRFRNSDMEDLEAKLKEAGGARNKLIATDGVFSMDGYIARLAEICDLAERHGAMVMVDDSHAVGFAGAGGRGTPEHCGVLGRVDILTGTFGKALGGACGGYTAARREIVELLRQRSRPYLFSNSLPPAIAATTMTVLELVTRSPDLRRRLWDNAAFFRQRMTDLGFRVLPGEHPIIPVMLGDAGRAARLADSLLSKGVYVIAFSYPVVPRGKARIRVQVSASHSREDLEFAARMFAEAADESGEPASSPTGLG